MLDLIHFQLDQLRILIFIYLFIQSSKTKEGNTSVSSESASLQEKSLDSSKSFGVKKRHSASEVVDRNLKTKSLLISSIDLRFELIIPVTKNHGKFFVL